MLQLGKLNSIFTSRTFLWEDVEKFWLKAYVEVEDLIMLEGDYIVTARLWCCLSSARDGATLLLVSSNIITYISYLLRRSSALVPSLRCNGSVKSGWSPCKMWLTTINSVRVLENSSVRFGICKPIIQWRLKRSKGILTSLQWIPRGRLGIYKPWVLWRVARRTTDMLACLQVLVIQFPQYTNLQVVFRKVPSVRSESCRFGILWIVTKSSLPIVGGYSRCVMSR